MSNVIYCFSGTGNCLALARVVAEKLPDTDVLSFMALRSNKEIPVKYERVGFVFPTCFGHPPKVVSELGNAMILHSHQKTFLIVTCGGGNILTISDFRKILKTKTQNPIQCFSISMPPNHIVGFSPFKISLQKKMIDKAKKEADKVVYKIQNDIPTKVKKDPPLKLMTFMSKTFNGWLGIKDIFSTKAEYFTTDACVRCGTCERICPVGNIKADSLLITFGDNCQQCMACIQWCPERAVSHPNVPKDRKRYHHPDITIEDMMMLAKGGNERLN